MAEAIIGLYKTEVNRRLPSPGYAYVIVPGITMLFAGAHAVVDLFAPRSRLPYWFMPFWIGLLCVPGYLLVWISLRHARPIGARGRAFGLLSIAISVCCAVAGAVFAAFTIVGALLSACSAVLAGRLFCALVRSPSP